MGTTPGSLSAHPEDNVDFCPGTIDDDDVDGPSTSASLWPSGAIRTRPEPVPSMNGVAERKLEPITADHRELVAARPPVGGNDVVEHLARLASVQRHPGKGTGPNGKKRPDRVVRAA